MTQGGLHPTLNSPDHRALSQARGASLCVIQVRRDFLACARTGLKQVMPGTIVQGRDRGDDALPRFGLTCSKKVGNAVLRNRAKRRLREAAWAVIPDHGRPGWDYVLIGRQGATIARPFTDLLGDVETALHRLHQRRDRS